MTSSVTVWTSPSTAIVQARTAQIIGVARTDGATYDAISTVGCTTVECRERLNSAFNRLVTMTMADSTLHIVSVVPMYENNASEQLQTLYDACSSLEHNITLHILGLATGIRTIFDAKGDASAAAEAYKKSLGLLRLLCKKSTFAISYSIIDDYAENGAPIGFSIESLSRYIAMIQTALMHDYYTILSPALLTAHAGDNIAVGISSLSFNRAAVSNQMLGLGFLEALDNVGINDKKVDAQKAASEAETILAGISERYPRLFERSVRPLYKDRGMGKGKAVAESSVILDSDINSLKDEILSLLKSETLSLPEKEAVLAMILGRDNENIRGMQYEHEGSLLDDACEQPINLYIEAFNNCSPGSGLLPVRGDFRLLKKYENTEEEDLVESHENIKALNPLPDIKRIKQEIINTTSFIREKQNELEGLQKSDEQRRNAEEIKNKWRKPKGALRDIEYKEQPLDRKYTPPAGLKVKENVDLRKFFTPVKNQVDLGSCTSFAVVAMYEAIMNQGGAKGSNDMSPAYLYYYSNILKGRPAGGSNFYEQFEVLGRHGVCHEDLYVYDADFPEKKPSVKADEDAASHRVLAAMQIPLINDPDKSDTLNHNHTLLTSALSEGYPVGISLKIYDNLGKNGAFILHPDDTPDAKEEGWHAMVIVGYSEANNFYIVRNSWGQEFGEDGYCYIPSAYIDSPDYMNFACIITEISDNAGIGKAEIPTVIANFAATEMEIRVAAIRNTIAKVRVDLKNSHKLYAEYYKYYQRLVMQLTMPKVQNDIRAAAELVQTATCVNVKKKKRELEDSFVDKLKIHRKSLLKTIISLCTATLGFGIVWYFSQSLWAMAVFLISASLCALSIIGYKWWKRIKRRELQDELDLVAMEAKRQEDQEIEMQIRFHVAGMWLHRFHNLSLEIGNVYDRLVSYNSTLRAWQEAYTRQVSIPNIPEGQMFRTLDASSQLHEFFESNKWSVIREVDLIKLFESFQVNPDSLERSHRKLQDTVMAVIDSLMADFNIVNFLLGDRYPYLSPIDLQDEISTLINVGQPSYRNRTMNATSPIRILIADIAADRAMQWSTKAGPLFPMRPLQLPNHDATTLILLTLHPQGSAIA